MPLVTNLWRLQLVLFRARKLARSFAVAAVGVLVLSGCSTVIDGRATIVVAPDANLAVVGGAHGGFDTLAKNALSDVIAFWTAQFPSISNGKQLPSIKGGLYSIDGGGVVSSGTIAGPAAHEACVAKDPRFIVDNAAYCTSDDSIVWDRDPQHLVGVLVDRFGPLMMALTFAHEFGHALQDRLGIFDTHPLVIDTESQADCAAGAFLASIVSGSAPHFRATPAQIDEALNGYLQVRDPTPVPGGIISHGNGFDRVSAINDGLIKGPTFCFSKTYFDRKFTERPFVQENDYLSGGNETLAQVLNPNDPTADQNAGGLEPDLNRFWTAAAQAIGKTFTPVKIAEAAHPKCGASATSEFGYCPDDNTVYYSTDFASKAYYSLTATEMSSSTKDVTIVTNQPADFALASLFAMGWGMAVRHQLFGRSIDDQAALLSAACYVGAYAKDINRATGDATHTFLLSPPDMDKGTSAMLNLVGLDTAFGARGTTGLARVQAFVKGYNNGLSVC